MASEIPVAMALAVVLVAAALFAMGVAALVKPEFIVAFFGTRSLTTDGRSEVRAVYGGYGVAMGLLLWLAAGSGNAPVREGVLVCAAVSLFGMAAGRVISLVVDGVPGRWPFVFLSVEVVAALLLADAANMAQLIAASGPSAAADL